MRTVLLLIILSASCIIIFSCKSKTKKGLMPELNKTDSAAVMYYDTANNPRFFKYTKVREMKMMASIISEVNEGSIKSRPDCATQGKIYFYGKGDAVYAVYFSDTEDCLTYSIIVTGEKYYLKMSKEVKSLLQELRKIAVVPVVTN